MELLVQPVPRFEREELMQPELGQLGLKRPARRSQQARKRPESLRMSLRLKLTPLERPYRELRQGRTIRRS